MTTMIDRVATTGPRLSLELAAVAANTEVFAARSTAVMAVVKADGFGHGAVAVARTALEHGASWLGVTTADEAHQVRDAGLRTPLLSWLNPATADWTDLLRRRVDLAVPGLAHLDAIRAAASRLDRPARVHLQADVGLARDGAAPAEWERLCHQAYAAEQAGLVQVIGLMGHLAGADAGPDELGRRRYARFLTVAAQAGLRHRLRHLAATAAALGDPDSRYDLSRIGAGLYGIGGPELRWALTLTAPVLSVRDVDAGVGVGYGHSFLTTRPTRLALLPIGYADGIPRTASGRAEVLLGGRRCPVVGLISMDQLVVDVAELPVVAGEVATVFGPGDAGEPTPQDWADWAGTIPHEILTGLGRRLRRDHTAGQAA